MFKINVIILVSLFISCKVIYNLYHFILAEYYYKKYLDFVKNTTRDWFIREHKQSIVKLLEKAGIEDAYQPRTEFAGCGMVRSSSFSVFRNLSVLDKDIINIINGNFHETIGVYKQRIFDTFNPFYWIEMFINLPTKVLDYLGLKSQNVFVKIIQLIWWLITLLATFIGILFNSEFTNWIKHIGLL